MKLLRQFRAWHLDSPPVVPDQDRDTSGQPVNREECELHCVRGFPPKFTPNVTPNVVDALSRLNGMDTLG